MRGKQLISSATLILQNLVQNCQEQEGFQEKKESTSFFFFTIYILLLARPVGACEEWISV